jgi:hypothetical protein
MRRNLLLLLLVLLAAASLLGTAAHAQGATVNSSLAVNLPPMSGGGVRNLAFGSIAPGGNSDTGAGLETNTGTAKWQFTGLQRNSTYNVVFTLPASLVRGSSTLPITYPAAYGRWCSYIAGGTCVGGTTFTPTSGATVTATSAGGGGGNNNRVLDLWIGAQISVPVSAQAGLYSATVSLTITGPGL